MVILVNRVDAATARAVGYARSVRTMDLSAVTLDSANCGAFNRLAPEIPLTVLPLRGSGGSPIFRHLKQRRARLDEADFLTVVVPEVLETRGLLEVIRRPRIHRLKAKLNGEPGIQVMDVPVLKERIAIHLDQAQEPVRNHVCVLVSGVHNATLTAIEYAETLQATDIRCVTFALDPERSEQLGNRWLDERIPHPLEIEDAPFRDMGTSLVRFIRQFKPDGIERVVTVVIPEFVVNKPYHHLLHGHTALLLKRHLLFEPGVVVVSVPYHLES